jgi:glc operon protein GlcG
MAAAEAEAVKNNWSMAIVILDSTGHIVMLRSTQYGSIRVAEDKAHTALDFRQPSKAFEDLVAQGSIGMRTLGLRDDSAGGGAHCRRRQDHWSGQCLRRDRAA